jgi:YHS domain-containing protein
MTYRFWLARATAVTVALLFMSWWAGSVWCQSRDGQVPSQFRQGYPPPGPCPAACVPKANTWGHFETRWRHWPGPIPLEQTDHSREVGKEGIETPRGREELPPPKAAPSQQPLPQQQPLQLPSLQPEGQAQPPEPGRIVAPEGLLVPQKPAEGSFGQPSPATPSTPVPGGALPGLPAEPAPTVPKGKPSPSPSPDAKAPSAPAPKDDKRPVAESGSQEIPGLSAPSEPKDRPPQSETGDEDRQPNTEAAVARPAVRRGILVPLIGGIEPERSDSLAGAHRADSIGVATPLSSADLVQPAGYTTVERAGHATVESPAAPVAERAAMPRVALGGYCPVELNCHGRWTQGDLRWTVVYQGWIYRLSGAEQRQQFMADPESFAPVNSCNDPVLSVDENRTVAGQAAYCAVYDGRLYMFSSAASQAQFNQNPQRYAAR